jgi:hypothetical protein
MMTGSRGAEGEEALTDDTLGVHELLMPGPHGPACRRAPPTGPWPERTGKLARKNLPGCRSGARIAPREQNAQEEQ